jgi:pimeloyl-ACP methyl ester carboxylesterase
MSLVLYFVEGKVEQLVGHSIFETDFMMHLNLIDLPVLFFYSTQDVVVLEENVRELYESYKGQKQILRIDAMHHQDRPKEAID